MLQRHLTPHPKDSKRQMQSEVVQRHRQMAQQAKLQQKKGNYDRCGAVVVF